MIKEQKNWCYKDLKLAAINWKEQLQNNWIKIILSNCNIFIK